MTRDLVFAPADNIRLVELCGPLDQHLHQIEARLGSESRRLDGKTLDARTYRELRGRGVFDSPVIPAPRLRLDTGVLDAAEAAAPVAALI